MLPLFGRPDGPVLDSSFLSGAPAGFTFTRASTKTYFDASLTMKTAAIDTAAVDYDPADGALSGTSLEASGTNLLLYSQQLDNAAWTGNNTTITADTITAPDGTLTADALIENTVAAAFHARLQAVSKAASALVYTYSVFLKDKGRRVNVNMLDSGGGGNSASILVDLSTGTIITPAGTGGTFSNASGAMIAYPNGWYRVVLTATSNTDTLIRVRCVLDNGAGTTYTGDGVSGAYIWGQQLEQSGYASSYIPTTATSVTRAADNLTLALPYAGFPGATGWTALLDFVPLALPGNVIGLALCAATGFADTSYGLVGTTGTVLATKRVGGAGAGSGFSGNAAALGAASRLGMAQDTTDLRVAVNGSAPVVAVFAGYPSMTTLGIARAASGGGSYQPMRARRLRLWPRKFSDAALQAATA